MKMMHKQAVAWLAEHESEIIKTVNRAVYGPDSILEKLLYRRFQHDFECTDWNCTCGEAKARLRKEFRKAGAGQ